MGEKQRASKPYLTAAERLEVDALIAEMVDKAQKGVVSWHFVGWLIETLARDKARAWHQRIQEREHS